MPEADDLDQLVADLRGPVALALRRASMFELIGVVERAAELLTARDEPPTRPYQNGVLMVPDGKWKYEVDPPTKGLELGDLEPSLRSNLLQSIADREADFMARVERAARMWEIYSPSDLDREMARLASPHPPLISGSPGVPSGQGSYQKLRDIR